jgi:hypothetical protein
MSKWIKEHKEVISILLLIGGALLAGIAAGGVLILLASIWRVL